jgi:putative tricarboxylic transport membrane protein
LEFWNNIVFGFGVSFLPANLFFCFVGVLVGTLVGVLPGIGPVAAMSLLLPITFHMSPVAAIIMLAGIYYGVSYGGSTTSILVNIPGEAVSVITCLDGYQMARKGRAGPALGIAAFGSFIAGTLGVVGVMFFSPPLAKIALQFGPPEYFGLMFVGLALLTYLSMKSILKSLIMAVLGLFLGTIGVDTLTGLHRFTFSVPILMDGISLVPIAMGLFGITEVLVSVESLKKKSIFETEIKNLLPTLRDWKDSLPPIFRGGVLGFLMGIIPGAGGILATFISYTVERRLSKHPEKFGTGMIEGVAGPESANNAASSGAFIPLLTLGIPSNVVTAMLLGALMIHGVTPGPLLLKQNPQIFWGVITSMYVGNVMLLVLNLPLIGLWVRILKVPYAILFPLILLFCVVGVYSLDNSILEVYIMLGFGAIGYVLRKIEYEPAPFVLALVLSPMIEDNFRSSLMLSSGQMGIFFTNSPLSCILMILGFFILFYPMVTAFRKERKGLRKIAEEGN